MAKLIGSSKDYAHIQVLSYVPSAAAANRLQIINGRYMYTPTDEYTQEKSRFIRAKFYK